MCREHLRAREWLEKRGLWNALRTRRSSPPTTFRSALAAVAAGSADAGHRLSHRRRSERLAPQFIMTACISYPFALLRDAGSRRCATRCTSRPRTLRSSSTVRRVSGKLRILGAALRQRHRCSSSPDWRRRFARAQHWRVSRQGTNRTTASPPIAMTPVPTKEKLFRPPRSDRIAAAVRHRLPSARWSSP